VTLEILDGGLLTTIQDAGRPGFGHLGVPEGGAVDPDAFAAANLLLGNSADAAAIEMTLSGPTFRVRNAVTIAIAGGDLGGFVQPRDRRLPPGAAYGLAAGDTVSFPGRVSGGARAYVALPGGVNVAAVLGSRSTCLAGGFGGLEGRPLRRGDTIEAATADTARAELHLPADSVAGSGAPVVRVLPPPAMSDRDDGLLAAFTAAPWSVGPDSDRMGLRLAGPPLAAERRTVVSHGVTWGTIQLPPDGSPIVLLADHQPTGGYPVVAVAIAADRGALGACGPRDRVRFREVTHDEAVTALRERRERLEATSAAVEAAAVAARDEESWLDLSSWAGG